ncbi:hypothetical protein ACHAXH_003424 [Discostella pseudostelligera]
MAFPPIPESPSRQLPPKKSTGIHQGRMHLYQSDLDDEVSVLTSHTLGTIDSSSISVAAGVMRLSRICGEVVDQTIISGCSKEECDHSCPTEGHGTSEREDDGDNDTISITESILLNANEVLSRIGSSPYYTRRKKPLGDNCLSAMATEFASDENNNTEGNNQVESKVTSSEKTQTDSIEFESAITNETEMQSDAYNNCFHGCFQDENTKPTAAFSNQNKSKTKLRDKVSLHDGITKPFNHNPSRSTGISTERYIPGRGNNDDGGRIQNLESETKKLQQLLKECQLETQRANQTLQAYRANHSRH